MNGTGAATGVGPAPEATTADLQARWLSGRRPKTQTTLDLYCFAHAGGSAGSSSAGPAPCPASASGPSSCPAARRGRTRPRTSGSPTW